MPELTTISFSCLLGAAFAALVVPGGPDAEPTYGIAMYGKPELAEGFEALPHVNPDAPKEGKVASGESGGLDSLNPYILKGRAPWGIRSYVVEPLMGRNRDEPFSLYGLLAESIEVGPNREWVEFTLRREARFSDGSPVTVEDVLWSFETLGTVGHPRYGNSWKKIASAEQTGPYSVRFTFNAVDRALPFEEAGWSVVAGILRDSDGAAFEIEFLVNSGSTEGEAILNIFSDALSRLGIATKIALVDSAQNKERMNNYDFEMTAYRRGLSLSPGNEQWLYRGSDGVETPGTRNYMGMNSPAAEAMIEAILSARHRDEFIAATRALDRVLTSGRYVIPTWHSPVSRLAHVSELKFPERLPIYGDWIEFLPEVWWFEQE